MQIFKFRNSYLDLNSPRPARKLPQQGGIQSLLRLPPWTRLVFGFFSFPNPRRASLARRLSLHTRWKICSFRPRWWQISLGSSRLYHLEITIRTFINIERLRTWTHFAWRITYVINTSNRWMVPWSIIYSKTETFWWMVVGHFWRLTSTIWSCSKHPKWAHTKNIYGIWYLIGRDYNYKAFKEF